MRFARLSLLLVTIPAVALVALVLAPPRERLPQSSPISRIATTTSGGVSLTPPPLPAAGPATLATRLAAATALARDLDPLAESLLGALIDAALAGGDPAIADAARRELDRFHEANAQLARDTAEWTSREAAELARDGSPAAIGRYAEAIAAARIVGDAELVKRFQRESEAVRHDLRRREIEEQVDRIRGVAKADAAADDEDPKVRKGFEELAAGNPENAIALVDRLVKRTDREHKEHACRAALRDLALTREAIAKATALVPDDDSFRPLPALLDERETRCRLEEGGRAIQRGDSKTALERLDIADLTRLNGRAPATPDVLYLYGRALEADGRTEEALVCYRAAIGVATWLEPGTPVEILRLLARRRAQRQGISIDSPGAGPRWHRLPRARFTFFHELEGSAGSFAARVEAARARALTRLGIPDPIRIQSKTTVFLFASEARYRASGTAPRPWAGGHASLDSFADGNGTAIFVFAPGPDTRSSLDQVLVHEWTHVLVMEYLRGEDLPSWAAEGAATWVTEPWTSRLAVIGATDSHRDDWAKALLAPDDWRYMSSSGDTALGFYAQSFIAFTTLVRRTGTAKTALAAAQKLLVDAPKDPFPTLGFKDQEDWAKLVAEISREIVPPKKK
jgi:tetratricopeptide (TPR) repeat protein